MPEYITQADLSDGRPSRRAPCLRSAFAARPRSLNTAVAAAVAAATAVVAEAAAGTPQVEAAVGVADTLAAEAAVVTPAAEAGIAAGLPAVVAAVEAGAEAPGTPAVAAMEVMVVGVVTFMILRVWISAQATIARRLWTTAMAEIVELAIKAMDTASRAAG